MFLVNAPQCRHASEKDCEIGSLYETLGATYKSLKIIVLGVFRVGKTTTLKMAKWLLHSYLQVALNVHSARTPSQDLLKLLVRLGNSEIMFSFVEGKTVWRIIGESVEDA